MGSSVPSWNGLNEGEELHILAVDDSIIDRKCIEKLLKSFAYKVTTVESGLRALEYLGLEDEQNPTSKTDATSLISGKAVTWIIPFSVSIALGSFADKLKSSLVKISEAPFGDQVHEDLKINLIITDYCMPGMTGFELLKRIKESSTLKEIPVVVMSSENVPTRIQMCLEQGAKEFILKPVKQSDVKRLRCHI